MKPSIFVDESSKEKYANADRAYWQGIQDVIKENKLSTQECLSDFQAFVPRRHIPKLLAYYELFKMICDVPGSIAELGVLRGAGLFTWSHLLETFCPGDRLRHVYGFDHFAGYGDFQQEDGELEEYFDEALNGNYMKSSYEMVKKLQELHHADSYFPGVVRTEIIPGDITRTVPRFVEETPGLRLSMLFIDVNLFDPIKVALECLYDRVLQGGVIAFSGYSATPWEGEANAVESFFKNRGLPQPRMRKFPWSSVPRAYFTKSQ